MYSQAQVETASGVSLMKKLCRHFSHKVSSEWSDDQGTIAFPFGECRINATDDKLRFLITAQDGSDLARSEKVITDHLHRMARDETLTVDWVRAVETSTPAQ